MSLTFRTGPPPYYISPSREEMKEAAQRVELSGFAPDLAADLANLAAGGELNPPSSYTHLLRRKAEETLPPADSDGEWKVKGQWTKDRQAAVIDRLERLSEYHQNVADFLATVDFSNVPGGSPLEKAMSLLKLLSSQEGGSGGGDGTPLPIFQEGRPEDVSEKLNDVLEEVMSLDESEREMLDPDGDWDDQLQEGDGTRSGTGGLSALKVAYDLLSDGEKKRTILEISRRLDKMSPLRARKSNKYEPNPAGSESRMRPMRDLSELSRIDKRSWGLRQQNPTYFWYLAATKQLSVRERVERKERKQAIFILVDGSGSMQGLKHTKATGVVMNRLKAVLSDDAEVWVSIFDTQLHETRHAATKEEAKELLKEFERQNFSGGGTDIAAAIRQAHERIEELMTERNNLYRPEIVVLTDEDSSITSLRREEIPGTRVHGFSMEVSNQPLVELARSTGGVGIDRF